MWHRREIHSVVHGIREREQKSGRTRLEEDSRKGDNYHLQIDTLDIEQTILKYKTSYTRALTECRPLTRSNCGKCCILQCTNAQQTVDNLLVKLDCCRPWRQGGCGRL